MYQIEVAVGNKIGLNEIIIMTINRKSRIRKGKISTLGEKQRERDGDKRNN